MTTEAKITNAIAKVLAQIASDMLLDALGPTGFILKALLATRKR
jgi:hypothetical protein